MEPPLKWTASYRVAPPTQRSKKLRGDKIRLPPSALEGILNAIPASFTSQSSDPSLSRFPNRYNPSAAFPDPHHGAGQGHFNRELPYPLTFRLVNPDNGRVVHSGILEFSAEENEVELSSLLLNSLGIESFPCAAEDTSRNGELGEESNRIPVEGSELGKQEDYPRVTIHAAQLAKGTYVRLRPLEPGYDTEDWKALLERHLGSSYTTLTVGEILPVHGGPDEVFQFLVDKVQPEGDAICVVDTDLEVDIEPLDEEQARESDRRLKERLRRNIAKGGILTTGKEVTGEIPVGQYVDYELQDWNRSETLDIELNVGGEADIDVFVSPLSPRQRARPRIDEHVFGDLSSEYSKRISIEPTNVELEDAEAIYVSILAGNQGEQTPSEEKSWAFSLRASAVAQEQLEHDSATNGDTNHADEEQCKNCRQWVPKRTVILHENFCLRNNTVCPKCMRVFQKRSSEWQNHWHCPDDDAHGNDVFSKTKHDSTFHTTSTCNRCEYTAKNIPDLAHHRTTTCPGKLILCQFCHLVVPQKNDSEPDAFDPEVLLSGLTPHEFIDGGRTTECHLCNRITRLRDMRTHLRHHDLDRLSRPPPQICNNPNCCTTLSGPNKPHRPADNNILGLCNVCFGPLYVDIYDPEGKALRRRIERRYLSQMLSGCTKPWCRNEYCKTGRANMNVNGGAVLSAKDALALVKPLIDAVVVIPTPAAPENSTPLYFCTDENSQQRRKLAEMLAAEEAAQGVTGTGYEMGWCVAAMESAAGDLDKAREWLRNWAPKKGERFRTGG